MKILKLVVKNGLRHKLRTFLTAIGIAIAVIAFALLSTIIDAYFMGVEASSNTRLMTRNAVSLTFPLPLAYREKIARIPGVTTVSYGNWFGGTYIDQKHFFAQFAIEPESFLELYPELMLTGEEKQNFLRERNSCIVGRKLAEKNKWELGSSITLIGTIFPGNWEFVIRGIYDGRDPATDESTMYFHWKYLDESLGLTAPGRTGRIGMFYVGVEDESQVVRISQEIDALFDNSLAETKTETEKEFQLSFIAMVGTVITAVRIISVVVIAIILLVLANTMVMTARERISEYAVMKTLGFQPKHLIALIFGESTAIALLGGTLGILVTLPIIRGFAAFLTENLGSFFPVFELSPKTLALAATASITVGLVAALFPAWQAVRLNIADGLRRIG
ncbi:MAG: ABC transporter permease [bacterium]